MIRFGVVVLCTLGAVCGYAQASKSSGGPDDALLGTLPVVEAAALHTQTLEEAPANVTIVTAEDIRKYGYRSLSEALSSVRGLFFSYDHMMHFVGMRGMSAPNDFNTRLLVMLNGHPLTDSVYNSNGIFGPDFGLDMNLVARIEIVRGPTSALYGSNAIAATINVVTKAPVDMEPVRASVETGSYGEKKAIVSSSIYLGSGANLLVSASVFNNSGDDIRVPGSKDLVSGLDGERGYHTFANLEWHDWSFTAYFNARKKDLPLNWPGGVSFERGSSLEDSRNFVLANYRHAAGPGKIQWQIYYDQARLNERLDYDLPGLGLSDIREMAWGDTVGTQVTWQAPVRSVGEFSAGGSFNADVRNLQQSAMVSPMEIFSPEISHPDRSGALFVQQEWKVSRFLTVYGGLRADDTRNFGSRLSPRLALVAQASQKTTFKFVYGRPFRNPSAYEQYWEDPLLGPLPNPALRGETADTLEASVERKLLPGLSVIANAYDYRLHNMIEVMVFNVIHQQYRNIGDRRSRGVEAEVDAKSHTGIEATASYSYESASQSNGAFIQNLPAHIGKFRSAVPLIANRLWFTTSLQYLSDRITTWGNPLRPVVLADCTLSTKGLHPNFDIVAGMRNLAGWRYSDPANLALDQIQAGGRSVFVKLIYHPRR